MTITVKSDSLGWLALVPRLRGARGVRLVRIVRTFALLLLIAAPLWLRPAHAQSPALLDMVNTLSANGTFEFDALERQAAIANDNAYAKLQPFCGDNGQSPVPSAKAAA